jgi:hypothetical protein
MVGANGLSAKHGQPETPAPASGVDARTNFSPSAGWATASISASGGL